MSLIGLKTRERNVAKGTPALSTITHSTPLVHSRSFLAKLQLGFVWQRAAMEQL